MCPIYRLQTVLSRFLDPWPLSPGRFSSYLQPLTFLSCIPFWLYKVIYGNVKYILFIQGSLTGLGTHYNNYIFDQVYWVLQSIPCEHFCSEKSMNLMKYYLGVQMNTQLHLVEKRKISG